MSVVPSFPQKATQPVRADQLKIGSVDGRAVTSSIGTRLGVTDSIDAMESVAPRDSARHRGTDLTQVHTDPPCTLMR
jgi:hypothetical protein